jgi:hypothetical protein
LMPSGLVMTRLPVPLSCDVATNTPLPYATELQE